MENNLDRESPVPDFVFSSKKGGISLHRKLIIITILVVLFGGVSLWFFSEKKEKEVAVYDSQAALIYEHVVVQALSSDGSSLPFFFAGNGPAPQSESYRTIASFNKTATTRPIFIRDGIEVYAIRNHRDLIRFDLITKEQTIRFSAPDDRYLGDACSSNGNLLFLLTYKNSGGDDDWYDHHEGTNVTVQGFLIDEDTLSSPVLLVEEADLYSSFSFATCPTSLGEDVFINRQAGDGGEHQSEMFRANIGKKEAESLGTAAIGGLGERFYSENYPGKLNDDGSKGAKLLISNKNVTTSAEHWSYMLVLHDLATKTEIDLNSLLATGESARDLYYPHVWRDGRTLLIQNDDQILAFNVETLTAKEIGNISEGFLANAHGDYVYVRGGIAANRIINLITGEESILDLPVSGDPQVLYPLRSW